MIAELAELRNVKVLDACEILGIRKTKLYELMDAGALPSIRIGGARRIPLDGLKQYLERLRAAGEAAGV